MEILVVGEVRLKMLVSPDVPDQSADGEETDYYESDDGPNWEAATLLGDDRIGDRCDGIVDVLASEVQHIIVIIKVHSFVGQEVLTVQYEIVIEVYANLSIVLETDKHAEYALSGLRVVKEILGCVQSDDLVSTDIDAQLSIEFFNDGGAAILVLE